MGNIPSAIYVVFAGIGGAYVTDMCITSAAKHFMDEQDAEDYGWIVRVSSVIAWTALVLAVMLT